MKIVWANVKQRTWFEDLIPGDLFAMTDESDENVYMAIVPVTFNGSIVNAINLSKFDIFFMNGDDDVVKLEGELRVKELQ